MSDNKVLVDHSEYKNLKKGDEIEIVLRFTITTNSNKVLYSTDNTATSHIIDLEYPKGIQSIHKILPKATRLEVGEIVKNSTHSYVVRAINSVKNSSLNCFVTQVNEKNGYIYNYSINTITPELKTLVRESGVPIDWDATFKS